MDYKHFSKFAYTIFVLCNSVIQSIIWERRIFAVTTFFGILYDTNFVKKEIDDNKTKIKWFMDKLLLASWFF